jgi:ABC-2 type transport system permease protein
MKNMYLKELQQYFTTFSAYIFLGIFTLTGGFLFTTGNLMAQSGDIRQFFSSFFTILLLLLPMLTMRQFSEEKKMRTIQLLFTLPLRLTDIVLGKFFATISVVAAGLLVTVIYPLVMAVYGSVNPIMVFGNYLGLFLLACSIVSIGMFVSSLTENQIVSSIVSYAVILGLWLFDTITPFVLNSDTVVLIERYSLRLNYLEFTYGILNPAAVIFYLMVSALFLVLTIVSLDGSRH